MRSERCKDLCLLVLRECPWGQFDAGDVRYVIEIKHGRRFHSDTVAKALRELWKAEKCESLIGGAGPTLYVRKHSHDLSPDEQASREAWQATWLAHNRGTECEGMVGPQGLLPEDIPPMEGP
jgi:hypothetical protein